MCHSTLGRLIPKALNLLIATCTVLLFTQGACAATPGNHQITEESSDGDLIRAVLEKSPQAVKHALSEGGNPNRIFGTSFNDWAMCAATTKGSEKILEILIESGGNPNLKNPPAAFPMKLPLTCALFKQNRASYDVLVAAGANLDTAPCAGCGASSRDTLFTTALFTNNFDVAKEIMDTRPITDSDIQILKSIIENRRTLPGSILAQYTIEFIEYLAERGITAVPPHPMD